MDLRSSINDPDHQHADHVGICIVPPGFPHREMAHFRHVRHMLMVLLSDSSTGPSRVAENRGIVWMRGSRGIPGDGRCVRSDAVCQWSTVC